MKLNTYDPETPTPPAEPTEPKTPIGGGGK